MNKSDVIRLANRLGLEVQTDDTGNCDRLLFGTIPDWMQYSVPVSEFEKLNTILTERELRRLKRVMESSPVMRTL